jgi:hypothetical protein
MWLTGVDSVPGIMVRLGNWNGGLIMGNRAVIAFEDMDDIGIYLHWQGGPGSILGFVDAAKANGVREPGKGGDNIYSLGGLITTIGRLVHRKESLSLGVGPLGELDTDNMDNGVYWIGAGFKIVRREHSSETPFNSRDELSEGYEQKSYDMVLDACTRPDPEFIDEI